MSAPTPKKPDHKRRFLRGGPPQKPTCKICRQFTVREATEIAERLIADAARLSHAPDMQLFRAVGYVQGDLVLLAYELRGLCWMCGPAQERAGRPLAHPDWSAHVQHAAEGVPDAGCAYCARCASCYGGDRCTLAAGHEGHHFADGQEWVSDADVAAPAAPGGESHG